jgi:hypothetical protein
MAQAWFSLSTAREKRLEMRMLRQAQPSTHVMNRSLITCVSCFSRNHQTTRTAQHVYEIPRKDKRGLDLISDALPSGGPWYDGPLAQ